jgi:hypothetical protein
MNQIRGIVIATLLAVWCFPAVGAAKTPAPRAPWAAEAAAVSNTRAAVAATDPSEATGLAAREARAKELQDFRGGSGVYVYIGSGALTIALIVVLLVLLV